MRDKPRVYRHFVRFLVTILGDNEKSHRVPPGLAGSGRRKPTHEWVLFSSVPGGTGTSIHLTPSKDRVGNKGGLRRSFIRERGAAEPPSNEQDHESQHRHRRIRKPDAPSKQAQPNHEDCRGDERKLEIQEL